MKRAARLVVQVSVGLALGLTAAELAFWWRDDGAFPHLNLYVPDPELGVRLRPEESQRIRVATNDVTTLHTNSHGLRGGEWPTPTANEVIVVGDSQVFGLGVNDDETFSAQLETALGVTVINAGVPTYGPREALALASEVARERGAHRVVLVVNVANDFFELDRPNHQRHAVWDGWAVRRETAPTTSTWFPFRDLVMRRSHVVFALRRLWHAQAEGPELDGLPSEGTWTDLVSAAERSEADRRAADAEYRDARQVFTREPLDTAVKRVKAFEPPSEPRLPPRTGSDRTNQPELRGLSLSQVAEGHPGDIVRARYLESSRSVRLTAELIRRAAELRANNDEAAEAAYQRAITELRRANARPSPERLQYQAARRELQRTRWRLPVPPGAALPPVLSGLLDLCAETAARGQLEVTLVVLPLDVQVSADEWKKYGVTPLPMENTLAFQAALIAGATSRGLRAVDLRPSLLAAEPGAFLDGDLHLSRTGHAAVARAIAAALQAPAPPALPPPGLPDGLAPPPSPAEWDEVGESTVRGSTALGCETKTLKGWFRMICRGRANGEHESMPVSIGWVEGLRSEAALGSVSRGAVASLLMPLRPGTHAVVQVDFETATDDASTVTPHLLRIDWVEEPRLRFELASSSPPHPSARWKNDGHCECAEALLGTCRDLYGDLGPGCLETYATCPERAACAEGHPAFRPRCPAGSVIAGAAQRCLRRCASDTDCVDAFPEDVRRQGRCLDERGVKVCQ